jgi:thioredoxin 2
MDYIKLACLKCGQGNRVPKDKVYQGPKCASCGAGLMPSKVSELSPKIFEKAKNLDDALLVVDFWAPWCGPCKTMTPEFEKAASKLSGKARLAKLNTEQYQTVATKLGIRGVPTLIGYRDGKEVFRKSGAMPAQQIEMLIKTYAK